MRRFGVAILVMVGLSLLLGDTAYARYGRRGRRGGWGFSGTAASSAMMGYAQLLRAAGQANLQNSQAAINWEKAKTLEIQNRALWVDTYFQMRRVNHAMRLAEQGPPVTKEQAMRMAHEAAPQPLTADDLDSATGRISYPAVLRDHRYDALRSDVDAFFKLRSQHHGTIDFSEQQHVLTILELFHAELHTHVDEYNAGDYGHAVTFLERLGQDVRTHWH